MKRYLVGAGLTAALFVSSGSVAFGETKVVVDNLRRLASSEIQSGFIDVYFENTTVPTPRIYSVNARFQLEGGAGLQFAAPPPGAERIVRRDEFDEVVFEHFFTNTDVNGPVRTPMAPTTGAWPDSNAPPPTATKIDVAGEFASNFPRLDDGDGLIRLYYELAPNAGGQWTIKIDPGTLQFVSSNLVTELPVTPVNGTIRVGSADAKAAGTASDRSFDASKTSSATVANGGNYRGLQSFTTAGGGTVGTRATLLAGGNGAGSNQTVAMNWRQRTADETAGTASSPPLPPNIYGLISDVVDLTGVNGVYALQLDYNPANIVNGEAASIAAGTLYLAWFNEGTGFWQNAGNASLPPVMSSFAAYTSGGGTLTNGVWGIDADSDNVWAIVNHNSQFSVVPEPGTGMLFLAGAGILAFRRRARR